MDEKWLLIVKQTSKCLWDNLWVAKREGHTWKRNQCVCNWIFAPLAIFIRFSAAATTSTTIVASVVRYGALINHLDIWSIHIDRRNIQRRKIEDESVYHLNESLLYSFFHQLIRSNRCKAAKRSILLTLITDFNVLHKLIVCCIFNGRTNHKYSVQLKKYHQVLILISSTKSLCVLREGMMPLSSYTDFGHSDQWRSSM